MTKYIVSGYIGFDNFGDELIARILTDKLKREGVEKITLISSNPERTRELHGVEACGMLKFFNPLREADVLISGGGSLLQDVTSLKSLLYYLGVIYAALLLGKKVEIFAQGIGPINSKFGQLLTRIALRFASKISVRDKKSQELLESWGIDSELVQDPVFSLELSPSAPLAGEVSEGQRGVQTGIVGIQLRDFPTLTDEFLENLARKVKEKYFDKKIQIISLQDSIDLPVCEKFAQLLDICPPCWGNAAEQQKGVHNIEVLSGLSINEVIDTISGLECLIAMRFHANVIALKAGIETIPINYDIKVQKLAAEYNLPLIELKRG